MADSTTMDHDGEQRGTKRKRDAGAGGSGAGIGKGTSNYVKEGYGPNMSEMIPRNIMNKGNHTVYHVVKQQKYLDFNYVSNQNPYIIPYQTAGFWASMWDQTDIESNNTINIMKALNSVSVGVTWIKGEITFEVYAVTRQRLLTGTTNQTTWDFETSQNMFIADADREPENFNLATAAATGPLAQQTTQTLLFNANNDRYTKYELPQRNQYTREYDFQQLTNNYMWKPTDISDAANFRRLIPMSEGVYTTTAATTKMAELTQQKSAYATSGKTTEASLFRNRTSYPRMHLAQPQIPDETGYMKFRYQVRMSTKLHLVFHLYPDYSTSTNVEYMGRQVLELPEVTKTGGVVTCMPYEIKT
ncbi:capsid protein [Mosquito densovirus BR/07]|uniref:capsid protein n=1 Tax=Mosquito densovirus BR/07 TaxID=945962 RepID=UPI0001F7DBB5|nr:capsid protein [Mosquito densovirus BR/07]ADV74759.1 capsid protein [Mosquito densovirus BR/07]